jgi:SPP1 gp7 family putative phage head morphogenesis protein
MSATASADTSGLAPTAAHDRYLERARQRDEPTQTRTIRTTYAQRLRGRWQAIMAALREGIIEHDAFSLQTEALVDAPRDFTFDREADQVQALDRWLQRQTDREILQTFGQDNEFVTSAYDRGIKDARTELHALGLAEGGASSEVGATALQLPVHREQLQALYQRNFGALQGMTDAAANDMRRVLTEGLASGDGPRDIARDLSDRVDAVGKTRANVIARTEVMHSHNRARATEWQRAGVEQVTILLAPDACQQCQSLKAGAPYPADQAAGLLPQHPNCRCALVIYTGSDS